jgi:predicted dithiol-disulfide oxidoreductase (DUF899 family)
MHHLELPNESDSYRRERNVLLQEEVELRRQVERVADLRRNLPLGGEVRQDYFLTEWDESVGAPHEVRLSELFSHGKDTLFLYSFMFVPDIFGNPIGGPCPSCTSIIDAVSGDARHVAHGVNLAVSAKAPVEHFRQHGKSRRWGPIRMLSSANSPYNRDYLAEGEDGSQSPHGYRVRPPRRTDPPPVVQRVVLRSEHRGRNSPRRLHVADVGHIDCTPDGRGKTGRS